MSKKSDFQIRTISDVVVHYLFARQQTELSLVSFINAVFTDAGFPPIKSAKVGNPFSPATFLNEKNTVVDVIALDERSRQIHIEVQVLEEESFVERCTYYLCKNYSSQLLQAENYDILRPAISIILTKFNIFPQLGRTRTSFFLMARDVPAVVLTDHLQLHFLQLPEDFDEESLKRINGSLLNWIKFFSCPDKINLNELKRLCGKDKGLAMAITEYEGFLASEELRDLARRREIFMRDVRSSAATQVRKALAKGRLEGIAIGEERGIAIGEERGIAIGEERGIAIGEERGIAIGEERGIAIGEERGRLRAGIDKVLELMELKFLFVPAALKAKVEGLTDIAELNRLYRYGYLEASSLDEMESAIDKALKRS